ncbi:mitoguardin 2 isoform X2 [Microcaecilia unicolor]|uniref:Mitoguardin 2 n=1 Tax=Microcaecilia unicolor TaxID=1415580 RepID=A0A6P7YKV6_9AMPH|nr:mitoguardin 2 isoform X2 [Microcaecilia unicolor]
MAFRRTEGMSIIQALAMTVAEIPIFLYTTFGQLRLSAGLRRMLFTTALGTVALALAAHQLKRRRRRKKQITQGEGHMKLGHAPVLPGRRGSSVKKGYSNRRVQSPSNKSNDTLSGISSIEPSKYSSSSHSLASIVAVNSCSSPAAPTGPWEPGMMENIGTVGVPQSENLYVQGMELFEEALHKWEQALTIGQRGNSTPQNIESHNDTVSTEESEDSRNKEFAVKLEALLHQAYHLQEEFGASMPSENLLIDLERSMLLPLTDGSMRLHMDDEDSSTSEESFFSAAELFDTVQLGDVYFQPSKPVPAYEEALQLVRDGKISCRTLRTELLGCYSDQDFLAKLHCVRQAFQELLQEERNRQFFGEVGKRMVMGLMIKAEKNPKGFLESYEEMLQYALKEDTWTSTQRELQGRGVVCMNFFDIALDFILMDAFEDLENPPASVLAVLRNRWLSDSFKETALATACWSVLKAKRRLLMVPDGFISHFYSVSEHVSPVLAFGFLGPKEQLSEICSFFKHQIVQYLKDMFDLDKVRFTSVDLLAEDILQLSQRRGEILLGYLGTEGVVERNGAIEHY